MYSGLYGDKEGPDMGIYSFEYYKEYYKKNKRYDIKLIKSIYRTDTARLFLSTILYSKLANKEIMSLKAYSDKPERIENLASYELESFKEFAKGFDDYETASDEYYKKIKNFFLNIRTFYDELK